MVGQRLPGSASQELIIYVIIVENMAKLLNPLKRLRVKMDTR